MTLGLDGAVYGYSGTYFGPPGSSMEGDPHMNDLAGTARLVGLSADGTRMEGAAYVELGLRPVPSLLLVPGVRADYDQQLRAYSVDPRLAARYELEGGTTLKAAVGRFSQSAPFWQALAVIGNPKLKPVMAAFPMPSHVAGRVMPAFIGGSDLAIPAASQNQSLAEAWIADFTSNASQAGIVKAGNLPNTTSLLNLVKGTPGSALAQAAKSTWFVPTAKNWANVESSNVLRTMLTKILTGKQTVQQAATSTSDQITKILNAST